MITIDSHAAFDAMADVVFDYGPDYVYPLASQARCVYTVDGEPSCLVGHALHRLGVSIADLETMDAAGFGAIMVVDVPGATLVGDAREVFGQAQMAQDAGRTWGNALREAGDVL